MVDWQDWGKIIQECLNDQVHLLYHFLKKRKKLSRQHSMSKIILLCACQEIGVLSHRYQYQGGIDINNYLAEKGLFGKIEFNSTMTSQDIILEVFRLFSSPMGLSKTEIEEIKFFASATGWCRVMYTMQAFCVWFFWMEWKICAMVAIEMRWEMLPVTGGIIIPVVWWLSCWCRGHVNVQVGKRRRNSEETWGKSRQDPSYNDWPLPGHPVVV